MATGDVQRVNYKLGPFKVIPGQNEIGATPIRERPHVEGYITRIKPDLIYTTARCPAWTSSICTTASGSTCRARTRHTPT
jgi:hypothetical protein